MNVQLNVSRGNIAVPREDTSDRCTPVCSKIIESNETMPNENKHNDIKQNRQFGEAIRNIAEMNISRISDIKKSN